MGGRELCCLQRCLLSDQRGIGKKKGVTIRERRYAARLTPIYQKLILLRSLVKFEEASEPDLGYT